MQQIRLQRTHSNNKYFKQLEQALERELSIRDGEEQEYYAELNRIDFMEHVIITLQHQKIVGCGGFRILHKNTVEIKRMYVVPEERNKGIAASILKELEIWASSIGYTHSVLETGKNQPEAIKFYQKNHYLSIPNFGKYRNSENSVCFEKAIL